MQKLLTKLKLSSAFQNIIKISSGTILGQVVSFITVPIFTRIYGASILGFWAFLNTVTFIVNSFSDLGMTQSIMVAENEEQMSQNYRVVSTASLLFSILAGGGAFACYSFFPQKEVPMQAWFIGCFIFVAVFTYQQVQVCYTWLNRTGRYQVLMKNPVINNAAFGIIGIGLGLLGMRHYGYFIGWITGQIVTLIHMRPYVPHRMFTLSKSNFHKTFQRNKRFLKYQLPSNVFNTLKGELPTILIQAFFGVKILGYYSITVRLVNIPINFLAKAVGRVFFQTVTDMQRKGREIGPFVHKNILRVLKIGAVPVFLTLCFGDIVINLFLGPGWQVSGAMIRILSFQFYLLFLVMSINGLAITLQKQKYDMVYYTFQLITNIASLCVGRWLLGNIIAGVAMMSAAFVVTTVVYLYMLLKALSIPAKSFFIKLSVYSLVIICAYAATRMALLQWKLVPGM